MDEIVSKGSVNGKQFYEMHLKRRTHANGALIYECRFMVDTGLNIGIYQRVFYGDADHENLLEVMIQVLGEFMSNLDGVKVDDISSPNLARRLDTTLREIPGEAPG